MAERSGSTDGSGLQALIDQFASSQWTDRKRAIEQILHAASELETDDPQLVDLSRRLVDGVVDPVTVDARAACHETIARLGRVAMPHVLARLDGASEAARRALVDLLGTFGSHEEVPLLAGLLENEAEDANVRAAAATALGTIAGDAAVAALLRQLPIAPEVLALFILDGLRLSRARMSLETLEGFLDNPLTCRCAVALLGSSKQLDGLGRLAELLAHASVGVRAEAVKAAAALWADLDLTDDASRANARALVQGPAWDRVHDLFSHREDAVVRAAITLVVQAADGTALGQLSGRVHEPWVAERVTELVSRLGPSANAELSQLLAHATDEQLPALLSMVGAMEPDLVDEDLRRRVIMLLDHREDTVARAAIDAVSRLSGVTAIEPLFRRCAEPGMLGEQAAAALIDVVRYGGPVAGAQLYALLREPWPEAGPLASNLCRIVRQLGLYEHISAMVALSSSRDVEVRLAAVQGLGTLGDTDEGIAVLSLALADEDARVRAAACRSLGALEAQEACEALLSATHDEHASVRSAAVQALVFLDNPVARMRYREIVLEDPSPSVIVYAIAGLARSQRDDDLSLLMSLCSASDVEVVKAAARALTPFRAHRATAALIGLFAHERWDVRKAAVQAVAERGDATALPPLRRAQSWEQDTLVAQAMAEAVDRLDAKSAKTGGDT